MPNERQEYSYLSIRFHQLSRCVMPEPSMRRHAFDFIEKDYKILNQFKLNLFLLITVCLEFPIRYF